MCWRWSWSWGRGSRLPRRPLAGPGFNFSAHLFQGCFTTSTNEARAPNQGEAENVNDSVEQGASLTRLVNPGSTARRVLRPEISVPGQPFTFALWTQLQTDYEMSWGNCGGGSPRWEIAVRTPTGQTLNIQVYLLGRGPPPTVIPATTAPR